MKKVMKYLKANPDFLIIGEGIFGYSIAWNISGRSSGRVLLLESCCRINQGSHPQPGGQTASKTHTIDTIELLGEELEEPLHWH